MRAFISAGAFQLFVKPASLRFRRADEGAVLDARDVGGVGRGPERVRLLVLVQFDEGAGIDEFLGEALPLLVGAVGPDDLVGRGEGGDLVHPGLKARVGGGGGHDGHG
jgi:hypothetical protein